MFTFPSNIYSQNYSNEWITGGVGNTALVVLVAAHPDVAFVAPAVSPGVLGDVVLLVVVRAVADQDEGVVDVGRGARWLVIDTGRVELEGRLGGIDCHRDRTDHGQSDLQSGLVSLGEIDESLAEKGQGR